MNRAFGLLTSLVLLACGASGGDPVTVAESYWQAVRKNNHEAVESLVVEQEAPAQLSVFSGKMTMEGDKVRDIHFAKALIADGIARVPTVIVPEPDNTQPNIGEISFDTLLVDTGGQWKVDKLTTEKNLMGAVLGAAMSSMGEAFTKGMQGAAESLGDAVTEGVQVMVEGLAEGLEQAQKELEEMDSSHKTTEYQPPVVLPARVSGTIKGSNVELTNAEWSHTLSIYEGDGWGFNPSVVVFLFLDEGQLPVDRTFNVKTTDENHGSPHIHYRWRDPEKGNIETEIVTGDYNLLLKFGPADNRRVAGEIFFSMPGKNTDVGGTFEIELPE